MSDRSVPPGHLLFEAGALECFCGDIFASLDVPGADARPAAESPVESDLRGVESHGVIRLTVYADRLQAKATNPRPRIRAVARDLCNALKAPAERKRKLRSECHWILLKAYDGVVNELGLGAPPEKEKAPNSLFGSRRVKQTSMLQSSAMTPSR